VIDLIFERNQIRDRQLGASARVLVAQNAMTFSLSM
jgi:hypothetical protein